MPGLKVRGRFDGVRDWMESCEWFLAVGTDLLVCRYGIPGFPISLARHWPSHPVTSSPGPNPPEIPPLGTKDSHAAQWPKRSTRIMAEYAERTSDPAACPTRYQVNSYNESIFCRLTSASASFSLEPPNLCPSPGPALFSPAPLAPNLSFFSVYHTIRLYDIDVRYSLPEQVRSKFPRLDFR